MKRVLDELSSRFERHFGAGWEARQIAEMALVAGALLFTAYFLFQWAMEGAVHYRKEVMVPDLRGKSVGTALELASSIGLTLKKEAEEFDDSVPAGAVLRQIPAPGMTVREGKIVRVVLSQGGETVFLPGIVGLPLRNAEILLRQRSLLLGEVSESYSLKLEKGMVLAQDPAAETSLEKNALVNVVISGGPPPDGVVLMPDFRQKNISELSDWAKEQGISVQVEKDPASLFPSGTVLDQLPASDTVIQPGSAVKAVISGQNAGAGAPPAGKRFRYEVSQGSAYSQVRIVLVGPKGEREIFNEMRPPGSKIDLPLPDVERAKLRVFVNGVLVEESEL